MERMRGFVLHLGGGEGWVGLVLLSGQKNQIPPQLLGSSDWEGEMAARSWQRGCSKLLSCFHGPSL